MSDASVLEPTRVKRRSADSCARVVVAAPKGGVGKTTMVMALLVCAKQAGLRAVGVNLDEQQSLTSWGKFREAQRKNTPGESIVPIPILTRRLDDYRQVNAEVGSAYDIAFFDTPPGHSHYVQSMQRLCQTAHMVLVPTGTSDVDLNEVIPFWRNTAGHKAVFLLNAVNRRATSYLRARQRLVKTGGTLCPVDIPRLEVIHNQFMLGLTSPDTGERGADDFMAVWDYIRHRVGV